MIEQMEQLYKSELMLCQLWFDLFRRFPMVADSAWYFQKVMHYSEAATDTFVALGQFSEILQLIEKELGSEAKDQYLKKLESKV